MSHAQRIAVYAGLFVCLFILDVQGQNPAIQRGVVTQQQIPAGTFHEYIPLKRLSGMKVLVICHGSTEAGVPEAAQLSRTYIDRWRPFAESNRLVLVAPIFDEHNYASGPKAPGGEAWGYRALDGRETTSDHFVNQIVDRYKAFDEKYDGRFYLYGHSAGAQFANHYLVVHPHRLRGAVLSAPAIYAMPDPESPWPTGMKARKRTLQWGDKTKEFSISHKVETWIAAVQIPVVVVIGTADTERLSDQPQQGGWTRVDRAQHYIKKMTQFAADHNVKCGIRLITVPKIGHSSASLTKASAQALEKMLE